MASSKSKSKNNVAQDAPARDAAALAPVDHVTLTIYLARLSSMVRERWVRRVPAPSPQRKQ
jgi:hypothetical protein